VPTPEVDVNGEKIFFLANEIRVGSDSYFWTLLRCIDANIGPDLHSVYIHDNIMGTRLRETRISCNKITTYAGIININNNDNK